jgi:hypothetical protein
MYKEEKECKRIKIEAAEDGVQEYSDQGRGYERELMAKNQMIWPLRHSVEPDVVCMWLGFCEPLSFLSVFLCFSSLQR